MIEKMKKVTIFGLDSNKEKILYSLRDFGRFHVDSITLHSEESDKKEKEQSDMKKVLSVLESYSDKKNLPPQLDITPEEFKTLNKALLSSIEKENEILDKIITLSTERERIKDWGDFNPEEVEELRKEGISLTFYSVGKKDLKALSENKDVTFIRVKSLLKSDTIALINSTLPEGVSASEFTLPKESLERIETDILLLENKDKEIKETFKKSAAYIEEYKRAIKDADDDILFERVNSTLCDEEGIVYISGYVPLLDEKDFISYCKSNNLGYIIDNPSEEDNPPTKVKHKGFVKIIQPLFDMLGLVPGYREKDISLYFLLFMTLFFAMIIGDAGYGLLFVLVAALLNIKQKKCTELTSLIYVFGGATVAWGAITGTWFGSETILSSLPFLRIFVIPGLTNFPAVFSMDAQVVQNNMMTLCFSIGAIHLSLACALCIIDKLPKKDLSFISDLGWLLSTCMLYLLVLYLVVHQEVPFKIIIAGVAIGFVLVCCFSEQAPGKSFSKGLKESLAGFFTTFINTISCFSNVMSYIRLFAVGMASLAIAQSFNGMAVGLLGGFTLPLGILVLLLGHAVNIVMGFLSIVVHGVRLNIMEFSGQVGVEWSGYKYDPFRKKALKK